MDRRDFLTAKHRKKAKSPAQSAQTETARRITSGINPYTGPWAENEIIHLLKRTMFGQSDPTSHILKSYCKPGSG
jgi:hypothetical protein